MCDAGRMAQTVCPLVSAEDRARLEAIVADRNSPQKHVWRARIMLLTADGLGTVEIMRRTDKSKTCVWRWQERFMQAGVAGLLRDKTRRSRIPRLAADVAERVVALATAAGMAVTNVAQPALLAPLAAGANVGTLIVLNGAGQQIDSAPLVTLAPVPTGGLFTQMLDDLRLWL